MQIAVIGVGKLGLCTAVCLAEAGYRVIGLDNRPDYVNTLRAGSVPFFEKDLDTYLKKNRERLTFTTDPREAVEQSDASFIIVPTPSEQDGAFANRFIFDALQGILPAINSQDRFHVINIVSTVMPGTCTDAFIPYIEKQSGRRVGDTVGLTYNPEFIAIGSVIRDFLNPDVVLIGESDPRSGAMIEGIYRRTCSNEPCIARTSLINAEIAKLSINCFCTMKISFANNLGELCKKVDGADAGRICEIIGHDRRIGTKYIKPGLGFGGPCFPRDNEAFINFSERAGGTSVLPKAVIDVNQRQVSLAAETIMAAARVYGEKVALLGLAYKPDTYLVERSQSVEIATYISTQCPELDLRVYDPMARCEGPWTRAENLEECVSGAHVAVILTPWPAFADGRWRTLLHESSTIIDFWK